MMDLSVFVSARFKGLCERLKAYESEIKKKRKREKDRTNVRD